MTGASLRFGNLRAMQPNGGVLIMIAACGNGATSTHITPDAWEKLTGYLPTADRIMIMDESTLERVRLAVERKVIDKPGSYPNGTVVLFPIDV